MTEMKAMKEKYTDSMYVCAACGEMFAEEDLLEFDGETYCADCLDERTDICACCGERIWHTDRWGDCETALCRYCYDHRYTDCESCGVLLFNDDAYYDENNNAYCEDCLNRLDESIKANGTSELKQENIERICEKTWQLLDFSIQKIAKEEKR